MQSLTIDRESLDEEHALSALEVVNERLETAIEQLRRANEALQLIGDALGTLNNQLEMMNEEVESLSREVVRLREGYAHAFDPMPYPVLLVDNAGRIEACNRAAEHLFSLELDVSVGMHLSAFPVQPSLGRKLSRKHQAVLQGGATPMLKYQLVQAKHAIHIMDVHFASVSGERSSHGVLVTFVSSPARDGIVTVWDQNNNKMVVGAAS